MQDDPGTLSPFDAWWETTDMDGYAPYKAAREAWDAASLHAVEIIMKGPNYESNDSNS